MTCQNSACIHVKRVGEVAYITADSDPGAWLRVTAEELDAFTGGIRKEERERLRPALADLIDYANGARRRADSEFCCSQAEYEDSQAEFDALVAPFAEILGKR